MNQSFLIKRLSYFMKNGRVKTNIPILICVVLSNISSEEESYLLAHNDGVYMIDSDETKLLYKDKNWKGSSNQISDIL